MLVELLGKGGCLCQPARQGKLKCPLIVRPTSEDNITGHLFQVLQVLNPYWFLSDLLNAALEAPRFRRQVYRQLRFEPWQNKPPYPRSLLPWDEGSTQVDCTISWEQPDTLIYVEMKYGSDLTARTAGDDGRSGYPSDQLIRNIRTGLLEAGWFRDRPMFPTRPRDFVVILIGPRKGHPLVARYRDPQTVLASIPHSEQLLGLPQLPFVGELAYADIIAVLQRQRRWFTRPERLLADLLVEYLGLKRSQLRQSRGDQASEVVS